MYGTKFLTGTPTTDKKHTKLPEKYYLHFVTAGISDDDTQRRNGNVRRLVQLTRHGLILAEFDGAVSARGSDAIQIGAVLLENLDAIVTGVRDVEHAPLRVKGDPFRRTQLRISSTLVAHAANVLALVVEYENAVLPLVYKRFDAVPRTCEFHFFLDEKLHAYIFF